MKITLLQQDISWGNPKENQTAAEKAILSAEKSDVYVLPEMFSTGFATEPSGIAEKDSSSLTWMKKMSKEVNAAIAGSIATEEDGQFYNRFYFVMPDGTHSYYDKHHLFTYSGEHKRYTAGNRRVTISFRGVRFLLLVCYDLRFPIWARNNEDYDCILYVASWPTSRIKAWQTLLKARAIENQCYVCGVNRIGTDPSCSYSGGTALIDPYGNCVEECEMDKTGTITRELDMDKLMAFREKFPVLKDRDK